MSKNEVLFTHNTFFEKKLRKNRKQSPRCYEIRGRKVIIRLEGSDIVYELIQIGDKCINTSMKKILVVLFMKLRVKR